MWSRRVSRGEANGFARLLDWSPSSRVLVLPFVFLPPAPFPADGHTNRRFLFFLSNQLAICLNIQHSSRQSVLSSFLRPFHPIILFDGSSGRMLCDRSGASLRQPSRANKITRPASEKYFFFLLDESLFRRLPASSLWCIKEIICPIPLNCSIPLVWRHLKVFYLYLVHCCSIIHIEDSKTRFKKRMCKTSTPKK